MTSSPRVLFVVRPDASTRHGGDTVLARNTFEAVKQLGVEAEFVETATPDPKGYDVAHVFNVGQPEICERQLEACQEAGLPIALSPVWLDLREFFGRAHAYERVLLNGRSEAKVEAELAGLRRKDPNAFFNRQQVRDFERRIAAQRALLERADVLLPNSAIEARDCLVQLGVRDKPVVTVLIAGDESPAEYWQEARHGLLSAGRVETRKNQTGLLFALRHHDVEVDIVGAIYHEELASVCRKWCPRARLHGRVPREVLLRMLGTAEIHALVSWCETAGIATLEAAAAGAKIVVADRGAEVEYFGDDADYADPADPQSIQAAVDRARARPPRRRGDSLDRRIRKYTWRDAARETLRAYELASRARSPAHKVEV